MLLIKAGDFPAGLAGRDVILPAIQNRKLFSKFFVKILKHSLSFVEFFFGLHDRREQQS